jgi:hypothetical protein
MSQPARLDTFGLTVVGQGLATAPDLSSVRTKQKASLYADPLSWLVLEAVERAIDSCGGDLLSARESVGHIAISDHCTAHTMREIAAAIPAGRISPLRFSAANPGSICSLPAQFHRFSGPSMTLSMPPDRGLPPALSIARTWLRQRSAAYVLITSHAADASGHSITSTVLTETRPGN